MSILDKLFRYQPKNRDKDTRVTWKEGSELFECYHEESDSYFLFYVSEIPKMIEVFKEIYNRAEDIRVSAMLANDPAIIDHEVPSTPEDTYLSVHEAEDGSWCILDEHSNPIMTDIASEQSAIAEMKNIQQQWHNERMNDGRCNILKSDEDQ